MALWIEYRTFFGGVQLREVCGGDFVIVSEDLCDEFEALCGHSIQHCQSSRVN